MLAILALSWTVSLGLKISRPTYRWHRDPLFDLRRTLRSMDLSTVSDCAAYMVLIAFSLRVSTGVSHCLCCICDIAFSHFRPSLIIAFPLYTDGLVE